MSSTTDSNASDTARSRLEAALIGGCLIHGDAFARVWSKVGVTTFKSPRHQVIWRVMGALHRSGLPIDFVTVGFECAKLGAPMDSYLATTINLCPSGILVDGYARQLLGNGGVFGRPSVAIDG